jgi:predicted FMN-binding regulatory protein PaiB
VPRPPRHTPTRARREHAACDDRLDNSRSPIDELNPALFDELLAQIVGFAIPIARLDGTFKLSQNRSPEDRARVARILAARGRADDIEMVRWMT